MEHQYRDSLCSKVRRNPSEWEQRARWAARRILSAVCFRETARSSFQQVGSALLPSIGFYYSLYHSVIACLWLEWGTNPSVLSRISHRKVATHLHEHLIRPKLVVSECADLLLQLRTFREYANYTVGGKLQSDHAYLDAIDQTGRLYEQTGQALSSILGFIRDVSSAAPMDPCIVDRIKVTIGDDIGEDVVQMYLSGRDSDRVFRFLVAEGLST